ncbi:GNAT family N-acetyltransferase [Aureimonas sp. N4]|uniref:GNAT family N-acetyltransferase n=1 Tax=Aureimonas sp. N4 TaxID=1638165 RepID=UPI0009E9B761|nr:GNAT family N-acetyltransferase [Aureimonas sp. N4]
MTVEYGMVPKHAHSSIIYPRLEPSAIFEVMVGAGVAGIYPDFQRWFFNKVVPGLHTGERCIFPWSINGHLAGVAICKRTPVEQKLCTLWVSPNHRTRGVAAMLARDAFAWLGSTRPLFTVPEERFADFEGLVEGWKFPKPMVYDGLYRTGRIEYVFNGPLLGCAH